MKKTVFIISVIMFISFIIPTTVSAKDPCSRYEKETREIILLDRSTKISTDRRQIKFMISSLKADYSSDDKETILDAIGKNLNKTEEYNNRILKCDEDFLSSRGDRMKTETLELYDELAKKEDEFTRNRERQKRISQLKEDTQNELLYRDKDISVSLSDIFFEDEKTFIIIEVKVLSKTKIIKPRNSRVYGYDQDSPNVGGSLPINVNLKDNFGNDFGIKKISPEYYRIGAEKGIKPNQTQIFEVKVVDTPLDSTEYLILLLDKDFFDSPNSIRLKIPHSTIFRQ